MEIYPPSVQSALSNMTDEQKTTFQNSYDQQKKNKILFVILAIFFPIQLFLLGKVGLGIVFWLTLFGLFIWWIIEIFLTSKRVDEFNNQLALSIATQIKSLG